MKNRKGLNIVTNIDGMLLVAQLYDTKIFKQSIDGNIELYTGGFKTNHTKNCINDLLPEGYKVYQEKGTWYLKEPNGGSRTFEENMTIKAA